MKSQLLLLCYFFITSSFFAQNTWTGTIDDKWSNENNWSGTVPTNSDDVLIPSGFVVTIDVVANINSIEVQGNSVLNVDSPITTQTFSQFKDNVVVNWISGDLTGPGILHNSGTINMSFPSFTLGGSAVLNNPGTINMTGGNILISSNSVLNNSGTGVIDFKVNGGQFGATSGDIINQGTIKTSFPNPTDSGSISSDIINQDGIFQIDSGSLNLNSTVVNFMGGEFNILSGASLNLNSPMMLQGTLFGVVLGDLNLNNDIDIASTGVFNFTGNGIINWISGDLQAGGTLTNLSIIIANNSVFIRDASTLENEGEIRLNGTGDIFITTNAVINNTVNGLIDFQADGAGISSSGGAPNVLNNSGIIRANLPNALNSALIGTQFNNNNGIIEVLNGTLNLNYDETTTLTDGSYNIGSTGVLNWSLPITISGDLTGNLDGELNWGANLFVPSTASFNFSGIGIIDWTNGDLKGGGVLTNENIIVKSTGGTKRINDGSTLTNNGTINHTVGGSISISTNSTLNNSISGVININTSSSGFNALGIAPNTFNNYGVLNSNSSSGNNTISGVQLTNYGVIDIKQNGLIVDDAFSGAGELINVSSGKIKGNGTLTLPTNFTNNGTIAPGASPGTLSLIGNYSSSATTLLDLELIGSSQGVDYDLLAVQGNGLFDGDVQITLGFSPNVNDEFIVATTSGSISACTLPATKSASFGGSNYDFSIACRNNNEVVLTVTNETLGLTDFENDTKDVVIYPNPATDVVAFSNSNISAIEIYDIAGKFITSAKGNTISVKSLSNGIYLIKGTSNEGWNTIKRLIKN